MATPQPIRQLGRPAQMNDIQQKDANLHEILQILLQKMNEIITRMNATP